MSCARQVCADRDVAVKMIRPEAAAHGGAWVSFLSEAMVTADLDHPNIVPIHDIGTTQDGFLFYAMKEVRGTCWKDVIESKSQAENLEILLNVCDAVAFAHSKGIVHRDLKPDNVMLGDFGEVLVMDWGLAVGIDAGGKAQHVAQDSGRAGTPAYMAPEMARCESARIGPASDIYLLGGILYEIATGLRPHHADNIFACIYQAMENEIQGVDQSIPDSLEGERPEGVSRPKSEARKCGRGCPQPRLPASESRRSESAHFDRSRTSGCETTSPRESSALSPGVVADGEGSSRAHGRCECRCVLAGRIADRLRRPGLHREVLESRDWGADTRHSRGYRKPVFHCFLAGRNQYRCGYDPVNRRHPGCRDRNGAATAVRPFRACPFSGLLPQRQTSRDGKR